MSSQPLLGTPVFLQRTTFQKWCAKGKMARINCAILMDLGVKAAQLWGAENGAREPAFAGPGVGKQQTRACGKFIIIGLNLFLWHFKLIFHLFFII
jgi:hypothetical protein